jgi:heterotetrameric sarcosine oxidase gamma subunit
MPELRSALAAALRPGRFGAGSGEPALALSERPLGTLIQLSGWRDTFEAAAGAVLQRLGFAGIGDFDRAQDTAAGVAFRIAPERVLMRLTSFDAWQAVAAGIDPALTPVLDLSHSRGLLAIAGGDASALLARLLPIDFDEAAFPPGHFVQSGIHSVAVLVHRPVVPGAAVFEIYLPRSYAASVCNLIAESAAPFGYRVDAPGPIPSPR